jgi:hypothetical protein
MTKTCRQCGEPYLAGRWDEGHTCPTCKGQDQTKPNLAELLKAYEGQAEARLKYVRALDKAAVDHFTPTNEPIPQQKPMKPKTKNKSKLNLRLLRRVASAIRKNPTQVNMGWWLQGNNPFSVPVKGCGTAGCIAGWAVALHHGNRAKKIFRGLNRESIPETARTVLGIDYATSDKLFVVENWPRHWKIKLDTAKTPRAYANVVAKYIEYFLKTEN